MIYHFDDITFNTKNLTLTRGDQEITLRPYELKLFCYLLENKDEIVSKECILNHVWKGKVVADQAVFQNISHLRKIFGSDAIKTYSKRGYQWCRDYEVENSEADIAILPGIATKERKVSNLSLFSLIAFFAVTFYTATQLVTKDSSSHYQITPIKGIASENVLSIIRRHDINVIANDKLSYAAVLELNEEESLSSMNSEQLVLTGEVRQIESSGRALFAFDFIIKNSAYDWRGTIFGYSQDSVFEQLSEHIKILEEASFFKNVTVPVTRLAKLQLLHNAHPEDFIILGNLVSQLVNVYDFNRAMILSERLYQAATEQSLHFYMGLALLKQSEILASKNLYELSKRKHEKAVTMFTSIDDNKRLADCWRHFAGLAYSENNYPRVKEALLLSAEFAFRAGDRLREINAITYLSVMAKKFQQDEDQYQYLNLAERKIDTYQLPGHNKAVIAFHYALFADSPSAAEPHLKQVIEQSEQIKHHQLAQASQRLLLDFYLTNNRNEEARLLVNSIKDDSASDFYLRSLLAEHENNSESFLNNALKAFQLSELSGSRFLSLEIALTLCQSSMTEQAFYCQFIMQEAPQHWLKRNKEALAAMKIV